MREVVSRFSLQYPVEPLSASVPAREKQYLLDRHIEVLAGRPVIFLISWCITNSSVKRRVESRMLGSQNRFHIFNETLTL